METYGLLNRMANLYNNKLFSDVEYRVKGTDGQFRNFYAHKLILASAGEGFAKIFYDPKVDQSARRKITEFTPHVFDLMLRYIYTDKIKLPNLGDAMKVFQLASCFSIRGLMIECNSFLTQYEVDHDSVFAKYDCALEFNDRLLIDPCRQLISKDTEAVFRSKFFCMASRSVIDDILKLDLNVESELEVIEAVFEWCKADCKRRYGSTEYLYVRDSFLPFCKNLRFLTLDAQEFFDFVDNHELLLTKHEIDQFIARLYPTTDRKTRIPEGFSISQISRFVKLVDCSTTIGPVNRFGISHAKSNGLYSYLNGESHSMKASSNHNQSHGTSNFNQTLNDTAKQCSPILSFNAQSNSHNFKQSHNKDHQAYNIPPFSSHPRQINGHSNSPNGKVPAPARPTYSTCKPENSPINNEPLFQVLPKTKYTPTQRVMPQPATKDLVMSYEFQLHEMQKQISSSCESDIRCHVDIKMLKGTIIIHGIELKIKSSSKSPNEEEIEVYLCITKDEYNKQDEYNKHYQLKIKPKNDLLQLPFSEPIIVSPMNLVDIEVMIDDLKLSRCEVCKESKCELNCGLDVAAQLELRSTQSNGNDSFVFLISKILYSVPKYF